MAMPRMGGIDSRYVGNRVREFKRGAAGTGA